MYVYTYDYIYIHINVHMCRSDFCLAVHIRRLVPKRCWGIRFMIVCVMDPIRYSSDINILERLHM